MAGRISEQGVELKELAKVASDRLQDAQLFYQEQYASFRKWVLASLLTIHGAMLAVLTNADQLSRLSLFPALIWTFFGVLTIVCFGIAQTVIMNRLAGLYLTASWRFQKVSMSTSKSEVGDLNEGEIDRMIKFDTYLGYVPVLSVLCFVVTFRIVPEGFQ